MGTRSDIIVHRTDGKWVRIYCHWDGYLSHNGKLLQEHYGSQELAEALVVPGDLSSLNEIVGEKHPFRSDMRLTEKQEEAFAKKYGRMNTYYGRDRGETGVDAEVFDSLEAAWPAEDTWTEFTYVWTRSNDAPEGKWYVADPDGDHSLIDLKDAIEADARGENMIKSLVKTPFGAIAKRA